MSVTSDIFSVAVFCPILGRMENITSLITWEIRPCCASTAIFVLEWFVHQSLILKLKKNNNVPVFYTFRQLIFILFSLLFLLLLLLWLSQIRRTLELRVAKGNTFWSESLSFNDGTTGFVDPIVFCALANFWWRSDNCDTAYALFYYNYIFISAGF